MLKRLFAVENILSLLLVFVPVAAVLEFTHAPGVWIFVAASLAIIPLAGLMGKATEHLASTLGAGIGGLLNATFGNAAELIIAVLALKAGLHDVVKASITGSIVGNILLVFGLSAVVGGARRHSQKFNVVAANLGSTLLMLSAIALVIPAIFHLVVGETAAVGERKLSVEIAVVLMITYVLSLVFTLKTHRHLYGGAAQAEGEEVGHGAEGWSRQKSVVVLVGATALVAIMSEFLVGAIDEAAQRLGMNEVFVGVILVALIGNAAEHSTAVLVARKNKMDLALNIAVGSSIQVALFVAPLLVFLSYAVGPAPMDLRFTTLEVVAVAVSVSAMAQISQDGETNWMEGVQLLAVYAILGMAFYFLPG
ncbi:MAG: calcium/proton exchanger [Gemmatimonadetes bacterium]|nr:calcium/proton exchanger [Gemmatimonadota bacterium]